MAPNSDKRSLLLYVSYLILVLAIVALMVVGIALSAVYGYPQPVELWWFVIMLGASWYVSPDPKLTVLRRIAAVVMSGAAVWNISLTGLLQIFAGGYAIEALNRLAYTLVEVALVIAMWCVPNMEPVDPDDDLETEDPASAEPPLPQPPAADPNAGYVWARAGDAATGAPALNSGSQPPRELENGSDPAGKSRPAPDWGTN